MLQLKNVTNAVGGIATLVCGVETEAVTISAIKISVMYWCGIICTDSTHLLNHSCPLYVLFLEMCPT